MTDLLCISDLTAIEPPQENDTDMMFKVEAFEPPERCPECVEQTQFKKATNYGFAHSFKASGLTIEPQTIQVS